MKILVTGAGGYIGKSIVNALREIHDVDGITRADLDLLNTNDVLKFFKKKYYDVVIHCAVAGGSRLKQDSWQVLDQNLIMYYNLVSCRGSYERLIHFGSGAEIYMFDTPYGYSKSVISKSMKNDSQFYNIRIFALFDENELDTRFIKASLLNYINKRPIVIHKNRYMDFFYMKDLISVVNYYITEEEPTFREYNCSYLSHNNMQTLESIANYINTLNNYTVPININDHFMDMDYISKTTQSIKDIQYIGLFEGIKQTYQKLSK